MLGVQILSNQDTITFLDGINAILQAMKLHKAVTTVQEHGCGAICNLAYNVKLRHIISYFAGKNTIVRTMENHHAVMSV